MVVAGPGQQDARASADEGDHLASCKWPPDTHWACAGEALHHPEVGYMAPQRTHLPGAAVGDRSLRPAANDPWVAALGQVDAGNRAEAGATEHTGAAGTAQYCRAAVDGVVAGEDLVATGSAGSEVATDSFREGDHRCGTGSSCDPCCSCQGVAARRVVHHEGAADGIAGEGTDCCCTREEVDDSCDSPCLVKILFSMCVPFLIIT